jgi:sulfate transport system substrate-binding protein
MKEIRRLPRVLSFLVLGGTVLFGFWPYLPFAGKTKATRTIVFYGFSILAEPLQQSILPGFGKRWRAQTGEGLDFISSFAGSGTITNQIVMGVPAELALLSLEPDADRLAAAGVIPPKSWHALPHKGVVNRTPFVILVRRGNPKGIRDFEDLTRPGVGVVHPDPLTSGGANWAILAEYGAGLRKGGAGEGRRILMGIWKNVVAQASSARGARTQFENGFGDALITYEQEALADKQRGRLKADIVYPRSTILSEHTLVVVERNVRRGNEAAVAALVDYLWSPEGQKQFVEGGFRSVDPAVDAGRDDFGRIEDAFLVDDLGGWTAARRDIIEAVWKEQVLPELGR